MLVNNQRGNDGNNPRPSQYHNVNSENPNNRNPNPSMNHCNQNRAHNAPINYQNHDLHDTNNASINENPMSDNSNDIQQITSEFSNFLQLSVKVNSNDLTYVLFKCQNAKSENKTLKLLLDIGAAISLLKTSALTLQVRCP